MHVAKKRKLDDFVEEHIAVQEDLTTILPVDCLYHVFKWLGTNDKLRIEKVCRRWRDVITAKGWSEDGPRLDFSKFKKMAWRKISQKRARYTHTLIVDFSRNELLVSRIVKKYFHRLEKLTITMSGSYLPERYRPEFFANIDKIFDNNKKLKVLTMLVDDVKVIDNFIHHVPSNISGLCFECSSGPNVDRHLSIDVSRFENLEHFELLKCKMNEDSLRGLGNLQHLKSLIVKCENGDSSQNPLITSAPLLKLEKLVVRCTISDEELSNFLRNCPNLRVFMALFNGGEYLLTLEAIKALSSYCPNLLELYFYGHFLFTEETMPRFPNLKTLVFTDPECGPPDRNRIVEFIQHAPKLDTLFASYCAFHPFLKEIHDVLLKRPTRIPLELVLPSLTKKWREIKFSSLITVHSPDYLNQTRLMRYMEEKRIDTTL